MGKNILLIVSLLLFGVLLFGCAAPDVGGGAGGARGGAGGAGEVGGGAGAGGAGAGGAGAGAGGEVVAAEVSGGLGEKLNSGAAELTVNSYEFRDKVGYGPGALEAGYDQKYVILNITLRNLVNGGVRPLSRMSMTSSVTDTYGDTCSLEAADVMRTAFSAERLSFNETRNGLVACRVDINARNIKFKYDTITVNVYKYNDFVDQLVVTGRVGEVVGNQHSTVSIKVNSVNFIRDATSPSDTTTYRGLSQRSMGSCFTDEYDFHLPGTGGYKCALVVLSVTVKNILASPWNEDYSEQRYVLKIGSSSQVKTREYERGFFEVLAAPLNLKNMAPGEERTGELIYAIGKDVPDSTLPIFLERADILGFGTIRINLKENAAAGAAAEPVQNAVVQTRD